MPTEDCDLGVDSNGTAAVLTPHHIRRQLQKDRLQLCYQILLVWRNVNKIKATFAKCKSSVSAEGNFPLQKENLGRAKSQ